MSIFHVTRRVNPLYVVTLFVLSIASGIFAGGAKASEGNELIANGSFEQIDDERGAPEGFSLGSSGLVSIVDDISRTGDRSVKIVSGDDPDQRASLSLYPARMPIESGETYRVTVWYRVPEDAPSKTSPEHVLMRLQAWRLLENGQREKIHWRQIDTRALSGTQASAGTENLRLTPANADPSKEWNPIGAIFTLPEEVDLLEIQLFKWFGEGTVWYDDLALEAVTESFDETFPVGTDLIENGSFEELDEDGYPLFFSVKSTNRPFVVVDDEEAHTGRHSVKLSADGGNRRTVVALNPGRIPIAGGHTYEVSVRYKPPASIDRAEDLDYIVTRLQAWKITEDNTREKVPWGHIGTVAADGTSLSREGNENLLMRPSSTPAGASDRGWGLLKAKFTLPEEAELIEIQLFNWYGEDSVWYDDVSLVRVEDEDITVEDGARTIDANHWAAYYSMVTLKEGHPRLLASEDDFERIRQGVQTDAVMMDWYASLKRSAQSMMYQAPSTYDIPDGLRLLTTSRRVLDRVETLAMMYRLDGDDRYVERAWRELEAAAHFPDWNPRHFLDTAEMTRAFAIAYDWLYDVWSEEQRQFLRDAIIEKGLKPALAGYLGTAAWANQWIERQNNWNFVVNSGITMGALAVADEAFDLAEELVRWGMYSIDYAIHRFAPDGGWDEGLSYWHYSVRYLIPYIASLESALGTDFGLGSTAGIDETGYFPIYLVGPSGSFNFADSGVSRPRAPELFWLARRFDQPAYAWWMRNEGSAGGSYIPRSLLWYDPDTGIDFDPDQLPLDKYFREVEVKTFRSHWTDQHAAFLGFKAGINAALHNELDVGTFVFDALGVRWAEGLGSDDYNLPGYFDYNDRRWHYYRKRAESRNTIVLNPGSGPDQDLLRNVPPSRIVYERSGADVAVAIADLTPAYTSHADDVRRGVALFDQRRQLLIQDEIQASSPAELWWFMHTKTRIDVGEDGRTAILREGDKRLEARIVSPEGATFTTMAAAPLLSSPNPPGQRPNDAYRKLAIHLEDVTDLRLVVQLTPLTDGEYAPFTADVIPLDKWEDFERVEAAFGRLPRVDIRFPEADEDGFVHGQTPISFDVDGLAGGSVQRFSGHLDGEELFERSDVPDEVVIDTRSIKDGTYRMALALTLRDGESVVQAVPLRVENTWTIDDPQRPPVQFEWFGSVDRSMTYETSDGWAYASDRAEWFFGDDERRVRKHNTREFLVWKTPSLQQFAVDVYAPRERVDDIVTLYRSKDGENWVPVVYTSSLKDVSEDGVYWLTLVGTIPVESKTNYFKFVIDEFLTDESDGPVDDVHLGHVRLHGIKR